MPHMTRRTRNAPPARSVPLRQFAVRRQAEAESFLQILAVQGERLLSLELFQRVTL